MTQERILQMSIHQRTKGTGKMPHRRQMPKQLRAALQQLSHGIQPWTQGQQRQRIRSCSDRLQQIREPLPFLHHCRSTQVPHHSLKPGTADRHPQVTLGEQDIPVAVGDHLQGLIQGPQNLRQGIVAWPTGQTTPQRRARFEVIPLTLKAMGGATGLTMGLQHEDLASSPGAERSTAEPSDAAADHHNVNLVLHPATTDPAIIVVAAPQEWPDAG